MATVVREEREAAEWAKGLSVWWKVGGRGPCSNPECKMSMEPWLAQIPVTKRSI